MESESLEDVSTGGEKFSPEYVANAVMNLICRLDEVRLAVVCTPKIDGLWFGDADSLRRCLFLITANAVKNTGSLAIKICLQGFCKVRNSIEGSVLVYGDGLEVLYKQACPMLSALSESDNIRVAIQHKGKFVRYRISISGMNPLDADAKNVTHDNHKHLLISNDKVLSNLFRRQIRSRNQHLDVLRYPLSQSVDNALNEKDIVFVDESSVNVGALYSELSRSAQLKRVVGITLSSKKSKFKESIEQPLMSHAVRRILEKPYKTAKREICLDILLAEDSLPAQLATTLILEKIGHKVSCANDGEMALSMAQSHQYDVLILDENMPKMNGSDAVERIRGEGGINSNTYIISMTGVSDSAQEEAILAKGVNCFVRKPVNKLSLVKMLDASITSD